MPTRLERFTTFLLQKRWQTLLLVFAASFVPVLGLVGAIVAALVTLVNGAIEGAVFMFAATLPIFLSFFMVGNHDLALPFMAWVAVGVATLCNIVTWALAAMLHRKTSWSMVLQVAALVGVLAISVTHLVYPDVSDWWKVQLQTSFDQAQAVSKQLKDVAADSAVAVPTLDDTQRKALEAVGLSATGLVTAGILFNAFIQLIAARWWQVAVFRPRTLRRELHNIRLSKLAGGLFILSIVLLYLGNNVISDIMPVVCLLFVAAGLSLIHYLFGLMQSPMVWFWLTFMYISILFALPFNSLWIVAMFGLADVWMDVRKRVGKGH